MSGIAHGMKKRLSMATTRTKKIEDSISADYLAAKKRLQREKKALSDALKFLESSSAAWTKVAENQKEFAELIETEGAIDGPLHDGANKAASDAKALHQAFVGGKQSAEVAKLISNVKTLITEIGEVEGEYKKVETEFNETRRYEKKVGRLAGKKEKTEKTGSNKDKLEQARVTYQSVFDATMLRMKRASGKFDAMLQSMQTAYWASENSYLTNVTEKSKVARDTAAEVIGDLAKIDPVMDEIKIVEVNKTADVPVESVPSSVPEVPAADIKTETDAVTPAADVTNEAVAA